MTPDQPPYSTDGAVTVLLDRWAHGDAEALDDLLTEVYGELRRLAASQLRRERSDHTLTPTGLVHEAYLRLVGSELAGATLESRAHFFAVAARAMRRILVEHARRYQAERRPSPHDRVVPEDEALWGRIDPPPAEILALDEALERLKAADPRKAEVVVLRYFGGLSEDDVAHVLRISRSTVSREWRVARLMLARSLSGSGPPLDDEATLLSPKPLS